MKNLVRHLPPVHEIQKDPFFVELLNEFGLTQSHLTNAVKSVLDEFRSQMLKGAWSGPEPWKKEFKAFLFESIREKVGTTFQYTLKKVINATGTILHTNLGRARLSENAIRHVIETACSYSNLEYDLHHGVRGSRHTHVEELLKEITGAEAAMVVNNNAAAVYLVLRELARGKEVIVSRGELVEIGGSFRISSIMAESGAILVEVGTTNKTHFYDYEQAVSENTGIIMKVHTSNFKIIGFTESVPTEELARLAASLKDVVFYEDLGSGALYDYGQHGIGSEPVVSEVLKKGADLVSFSGDKLLGGPQAGIIVGKKHLIDRLKKNQLARVVRVDKMTIAALEATLMDYMKGIAGLKNIPVARDLLTTREEMVKRSKAFAEKLLSMTDQYSVDVRDSIGQVGGGTMPDVELPSAAVFIKHKELDGEDISVKLRREHKPPIIVRIQKDEIVLDLRCVTPEEEEIILSALAGL